MVTKTATKVDGATQIRRYTCSNSTGILKNKILTLSDPRTAAEVTATATAAGVAFAGISAEEKEASDGATSIGAYVNGIWEMYASGAIAVGALVYSVGDGYVAEIMGGSSSGALVGRCLETASNGEVVNIAVGSIV